MQTTPYTLTKSAWVDILANNKFIFVQIKTAAKIALHFNNDGPPALSAAFVEIDSWPPFFDFLIDAHVANAAIWARAIDVPCDIVVVTKL